MTRAIYPGLLYWVHKASEKEKSRVLIFEKGG